MQDTTITCHHCGTTIAISDLLRGEMRQELAEEQQRAIHAATTRAEQQAQERLQGELQAMQQQVATQQQKALQEIALLQQRISATNKAELALREEKAKLETRANNMEQEIQRRLDHSRQQLEYNLRNQLAEEQALKLKQKDQQILNLIRDLDNAKRRGELGSQELQGEVLELDIQSTLQYNFPHDHIQPVLKGMRGADIIQTVMNNQLQACGTIIWESKNTKTWQPIWLDKLKEDQRSAGAAIAILVSVIVPEQIHGFGRIDNIWVSDLKSWPALAAVLREQLIQVRYANAANQGLDTKMELLWRYFSQDEFRQRVETIIEAFEAMQTQIHKERRAMEKHWHEREKQLQRVISSTTAMYGSLQGIIGKAMPIVEALEFDDHLSLNDDSEC